MNKFSSNVCNALQHYVYALIDPRDSSIFYVGKANSNNRAWDHFKKPVNASRKSQRIEEIRNAGVEPKVEVLRYGLTAEGALEVEAAIIDTLGFDMLTNEVRGHGVGRGRVSTSQLAQLYATKSVELSEYSEPMILFFIGKTYSPDHDNIELYDNVRQFWRIGAHARTVDPSTGQLPYRSAVGVVDSIAVAVYSIEAWFPAESTVSTRLPRAVSSHGKWEFVGRELPNHFLKGAALSLNGQKIVAMQQGFKYFPDTINRRR